jgi:hypothetical protein
MTNRTMDVRWHDITNTAELDLYLGPDTFDTETVVTVVCGEISGELDRVVSRDQDGGLVLHYEARIDGLWPVVYFKLQAVCDTYGKCSVWLRLHGATLHWIGPSCPVTCRRPCADASRTVSASCHCCVDAQSR